MNLDDTGYCGSMNITKDNASPAIGGTSGYYDILMRINGPAVSDLGHVFSDSLRESRSGVMVEEIPRPPPQEDGVYVQILESNVRQKKREIQKAIRDVVFFASESIKITSSYFIPPTILKTSLLSSCTRGVKTDLLLSGNSDVLGDEPASRHTLKPFLSLPGRPCKISMLQNKHCHAKACVVDGLWSSVGSFNWDRYSFRRNLEVTVSVFDPNIAKALATLQETKIRENSIAMTLEDWDKRSSWRKMADRVIFGIARFTGASHLDGLDAEGGSGV
eukprot:GHVO01038938.1.p1 GENE.GHVO01038938.1~~GHVO01038938.1.p1  ORF type:complete len:275 (+),score=40.25 GHVO01038938.1:1-825(+)